MNKKVENFFIHIIVLSEQIFAHGEDISGAHGDQNVSRLTMGFEEIFDFFKGREIIRCHIPLLQFRQQIFGMDHACIRFPCRVDIGQYHVIG